MKKSNIIKIFTILLVLLLGVILVLSLSKSGQTSTTGINYQCPMHPEYIADKQGDCPICGMSLVPVKSSLLTDPSKVSGLKNISITGEQEQLIGVKTAPVKRRNLEQNIRASGKVAHDEELYSAVSEYKQSLLTYEELKAKKISEENIKQTEEMLQAIRFKLAHMGISRELADKMVKENKFSNLLYTGKSGGTVWIYAQIYDYESGRIKEGQTIEAVSSAAPGKIFKGKIGSVGTYLDSETRTLRIRAEVQNPEGLLKPEMYVDTLIHIPLGQKLAVPVEAIMDTGTRKVVFVKSGPGIYEPREIITGAETDSYYEVLSGLKEGEEVAISANFLLDSESRLKAISK